MFLQDVLLCLCIISNAASKLFLEVDYQYHVIEDSEPFLSINLTKINKSPVSIITLMNQTNPLLSIKSITSKKPFTVFRITPKYGLEVLPKFALYFSLEVIQVIGQKISKVSRDSLSDIVVRNIYLDRNQIHVIENESFGVQVRLVSLNCNKISEVTLKWFLDISSLKELYLRNNLVESIPEKFLSNALMLDVVDLGNNRIKTIGKDAFHSGANPRWRVWLDHNLLTEIKEEAFRGKIVSLDLSYNRLNYLSKSLRKKLFPSRISLVGNPWHCPCWYELGDWIANHGGTEFGEIIDDNPICVSALFEQNTCVESYNPELYNRFSKSVTVPESQVCLEYRF